MASVLVVPAIQGLHVVATSTLDSVLLVAGGLAIGAILGAGVSSAMRRRDRQAEDVRPRRPSPSSVGLDDDPIVAALVGSRGPTSRARLPGDGDPLT